MTTINLINELKGQPPEAEVLIVGEVVCDHADHADPGYVNIELVGKVVRVRSVHPRVVHIEVKE